MKTKNDVTKKRLAQRIEKANSEVPQSIQRMLDDAAKQKDFMVRLGEGMENEFQSDQRVMLATKAGDFNLHDNAVSQLAGKYNISSREIKKYLAGNFPGDASWQHDTVAYILNQHSQHARQERFLMRAVGNEVRGVLSEYYKVFDNEILTTEFLKYAKESGAQFAGGHYNGINLWIEMLLPQTFGISTVKNGDVEIAVGARFKNSEFGASSFQMRSFFMNAVCANGVVGENLLHHRHVGEKLPEGIELSRELILTNTRKTKLEVRDYTRHLFSEEYVRRTLTQIENASGIEVDIKKELEKLKLMGCTKVEVEEVQDIILNNRKEDGVQGENTLWKMTQAITAMSRDKNEERKRDLQELVGTMLPQPEKAAELFTN